MREVDVLDINPRPSDSLKPSERTKHQWHDYGTNYGDEYRCRHCNIPQYDYRTSGQIVDTEYCEDKQWAYDECERRKARAAKILEEALEKVRNVLTREEFKLFVNHAYGKYGRIEYREKDRIII